MNEHNREAVKAQACKDGMLGALAAALFAAVPLTGGVNFLGCIVILLGTTMGGMHFYLKSIVNSHELLEQVTQSTTDDTNFLDEPESTTLSGAITTTEEFVE